METLKVVAEVVAIMSSLSSLGVVAVIGYQHRLMWADFRKKHDLNGNSRE